jgi:hypothetical protein
MASAGTSAGVEIFSRLSKGSRSVLTRSQQYSRPLKKIHMEHFFFALFDKPNGLTRTIFNDRKLTRGDLEREFRKAKFAVPPIQEIESELRELPEMSKHVKEALAQASILAAKDGKREVITRYLLMGALSVADCSAVQVMEKLGVSAGYVGLAIYPERYSTLRSASSDTATTDDKLGFRPYVTALAAFLQSDQTRPPLTLSIEGEWGSGKSSFMKQLAVALGRDEELVKGDCVHAPHFRTVFRKTSSSFLKRLWNVGAAWSDWMRSKPLFVNFNAWRHDKEEALWAAFALAFSRQTLNQQVWPRRVQRRIRLFWKQYNWRKGWLEIARICGVWLLLFAIAFALLLPFVYPRSKGWRTKAAHNLACALSGGGENADGSCAPPQPNPQSIAKTSETKKPESKEQESKTPQESKDDLAEVLKALITYGGGLGSLAVTAAIWKKIFKATGNPFETKIRSYLRSPDYDTKIAFVERFHEDFRRMVESCVPEDQKVYVFIDDLDRCDIPKAAELMQALNLLISDEPHLVFILGLDRRKVAAGIAVKNKELLPYLYAKNGDEKLSPAEGLKYGTEFIEKFIQLPFRVPEPTVTEFRGWIRQLTGKPAGPKGPDGIAEPSGLDSRMTKKDTSTSADESFGASLNSVPPDPVEELRKRVESDLILTEPAVLMVAPALGNNPRRLKQFVNLFRLQYYLCEELRLLSGPNRLSAEKIAKFVAIALKWPELLAELPKNPDLLWQLQKIAIGEEHISANAPAIARALSGDMILCDLLAAHIKTRVEKFEDVNFLNLLTVCATQNEVVNSIEE